MHPKAALKFLGWAVGEAPMKRDAHDQAFTALNVLDGIVDRLALLEEELGHEQLKKILQNAKLKEEPDEAETC